MFIGTHFLVLPRGAPGVTGGARRDPLVVRVHILAPAVSSRIGRNFRSGLTSSASARLSSGARVCYKMIRCSNSSDPTCKRASECILAFVRCSRRVRSICAEQSTVLKYCSTLRCNASVFEKSEIIAIFVILAVPLAIHVVFHLFVHLDIIEKTLCKTENTAK